MEKQSTEFKEWFLNSGLQPEQSDAVEAFWNSENTSDNLHDEMLEDWSSIERKINPSRSVSKWYYSAAAILLILISSSLIWISQKNYVTSRAWFQAEKTVTLPDGSSVQLSKGSRIKYLKTFEAGKRSVDLFGEAFFNITANHDNPFIVNTGQTKIKVTGTSFRVSAFHNKDQIAVQVIAGKVLFYNSETLTPSSFRVGLGAGDIGVYLPKLNQLNKKQFIATP